MLKYDKKIVQDGYKQRLGHRRHDCSNFDNNNMPQLSIKLTSSKCYEDKRKKKAKKDISNKTHVSVCLKLEKKIFPFFKSFFLYVMNCGGFNKKIYFIKETKNTHTHGHIHANVSNEQNYRQSIELKTFDIINYGKMYVRGDSRGRSHDKSI